MEIATGQTRPSRAATTQRRGHHPGAEWRPLVPAGLQPRHHASPYADAGAPSPARRTRRLAGRHWMSAINSHRLRSAKRDVLLTRASTRSGSGSTVRQAEGPTSEGRPALCAGRDSGDCWRGDPTSRAAGSGEVCRGRLVWLPRRRRVSRRRRGSIDEPVVRLLPTGADQPRRNAGRLAHRGRRPDRPGGHVDPAAAPMPG